MVLLGNTPAEFVASVRTRSEEVYNLLLKAARPILHFGTEVEAACLHSDAGAWVGSKRNYSKL